MVRYYGFYSNKSRGLRKKAGTDDDVPALIKSGASSKEFRKNWARLIQKIYNIKIFKPSVKNQIDNKARFGYQHGYSGRLIGVSICWATSETGTQFTIFP